jgi:crotonobetainyl-CoA:carnitine CoA-transferase CaiB-like acyl-CoA transferase
MPSLLEAQIFMLDFQAARYLMKGEVAGQEGNFHPTSPGTGMFQTEDGYINVAASGDNLWRRFCEAAGAKDCSAIRIFRPWSPAPRTARR